MEKKISDGFDIFFINYSINKMVKSGLLWDRKVTFLCVGPSCQLFLLVELCLYVLLK